MNETLENITILEDVLAVGQLSIEKYNESLPLWLKQAATYYRAHGKNGDGVILIWPKGDPDYETLIRVYTHISKKTQMLSFLVTDRINSRYRSLFVKNKIPFIHKAESIFAPGLGVKLQQADLRKQPTKNETVVGAELSPFGLKLIAGYLTDHITFHSFNLEILMQFLKKKNYFTSKTKLSRVTKELIHLGLLDSKGLGPSKKLHFKNKQEVWDILRVSNIKTASKTIEASYQVKSAKLILSGESALSSFTDLSEPTKTTFAVTNKQFIQIKKNGSSIDGTGKASLLFEIRKESPELFSFKNSLNPVELYFDLKNHFDERIQISLRSMMEKFNLRIKNE
jgi:hypothetical protein